MPLGSYHVEPAEVFYFLRLFRLGRVASQDNVHSAARHIGRNRDRFEPPGLRDDRALALVVLRIQHLVRNSGIREERGDQLVLGDGRRADEDGLPLLVPLLDVPYRGLPFCLRVLVDLVREVFAHERPVGRDAHDLKPVDLMEFLGRGLGSSGHACDLLVHPEVVLDGYFCIGSGFLLDLDAFFGFYRLMEAARIAPAVQEPPGEFVHDDDLAVLHHVVLVAVEDRFRPQAFFKIVHEPQVLRRVDVREAGELFHLLDPLLRDGNGSQFFVHGEVLVFLEMRRDPRERLIELA